MRSVVVIAAVELRRFLRDRSNIFFVFILPLLLVALIGAQFGEGADAGRVAVSGVDGELRERLVDDLERPTCASANRPGAARSRVLPRHDAGHRRRHPARLGYQAFADIRRRNGTLADIAPQLAVLGAMAAGVLVLGAWSLRRPLARPT